MRLRRAALGRPFGLLWSAYAVSAYGTGLGFGAFAFIAVTVLHASAGQVSALSVVGVAVGAVVAVPLGPWVEYRRKRPVMIGMDVVRFAAMGSVPVAYGLGVLGFGQLLAVSAVVAAAKIAFNAASGVYLKSLVDKEHLLVAAGRFESTTWSATVVGPVLGGAAMGLLGPVTTVIADCASYLLSALGIAAIRRPEPAPPARTGRLRPADLAEGWRYLLGHGTLRPLFLNSVAVNALIMACEPLLTFLMLGPLGFPTWEYGLAFAVPCLGGLIGSRLARRVVARWSAPRVLGVLGALRACWPIGLALVRPGVPGLLVVMVVESGLIACISMFNPVLAAQRLEHTEPERLTRVLSAWSITSSAAIAGVTALWGLLAELAGPRPAIAVAGVLMLATPLLLGRRRPAGGGVPALAGQAPDASARSVSAAGRASADR